MAALLEGVSTAELSSSEALATASTLGDPPVSDALFDDAWHALVHFDHDEDIRASDADYAATQQEGLRRWAERLRRGTK